MGVIRRTDGAGTRSGPATDRIGRTATALQAHLLLVIACLPILGMLVIAPVLPEMQRAFAGVPGVAYLVPLVLTAPALMIVIVSPFSGSIARLLGRRNALIGALALYLALATAPLWLATLPAILVSRLGVGVAEAILMTVSTMLLGDYFEPDRRDRYLAYQVVYTSVSAVIFLIIGGMLGEAGWRVPFTAYFAALAILPAAIVFIWEPTATALAPAGHRRGALVPWRAILPICAITFFAGGCMNLVSVDLGYLIEAAGVTATTIKGIGAAINSGGIAIGAALYSVVAGRPRQAQLAAAFVVSAMGFLLLALASSLPGVIAGGGVAGLASGFYLAWLLAAVNRPLSFETRGPGVGLWMMAYFLATILAPLSVVAISGLIGGVRPAMLVFAGVMLVFAGVMLALALAARRLSTGEAAIVPQATRDRAG